MNAGEATSGRAPTPLTLGLVNGLIFAAGPATVDMSLPAMPAIQQAIGSGALRVELTLTLLLLGLAVTQLLYGAIADRYGRRLPLLAGMLLYCAASLYAASASDTSALAAARVLQALGYGVTIVLSRSAIADVCDARDSGRAFSIAITLMSISSVIAPSIGGQLLVHLGWRAIFYAMAAYGLVTLAVTAVLLPETHAPARRTKLPVAATLSSYAGLLRERRFLAFCGVAGCIVACQFTYNTAGPGVLIEHYGLTPGATGLLLSVIALSTAVAAPLNVVALRARSIEQVMRAALWVAFAAAVLLLCLLLAGSAVAPVIAMLFLLLTSPAFVVTNALAGGISSAGARAGAASALIGVMQFAFGTAGSAVAAGLHDTRGIVMGVIIVVAAGAAVAFARGLRQTAPSAAAA